MSSGFLLHWVEIIRKWIGINNSIITCNILDDPQMHIQCIRNSWEVQVSYKCFVLFSLMFLGLLFFNIDQKVDWLLVDCSGSKQYFKLLSILCLFLDNLCLLVHCSSNSCHCEFFALSFITSVCLLIFLIICHHQCCYIILSCLPLSIFTAAFNYVSFMFIFTILTCCLLNIFSIKALCIHLASCVCHLVSSYSVCW